MARALGVRGVAIKPLQDQRGVDVVIVVFPVVFNFLLPVFSKVVDSNAVGFDVDDRKKFGAELDKMGVIKFAFKDGVLDTLPVVEAGFSDVT